jgi:leucyl aminopeptidase
MPHIKIKIRKKDILENKPANIVLKISKRLLKQKYSLKQKKKKDKKKRHGKRKEEKEKKSPKRMTIKYKNLYGRVIHFAKSLEAEPPD